MRRILVIPIMLLATILLGAPQAPQKITLKTALAKVRADGDAAITTNPLQSFSFDKYSSRSYLYFYRASAYVQMAKHSPKKLLFLEHALDDLRRAQVAPNFDMQRVTQLTADVVKDKIEVLRAQKNHSAVIEAIEQLSAKDKTDSHYILYYGEALFNSGRVDDFKRLARTYLKKFNDDKLVVTHLSKAPDWHETISSIASTTTDTIQDRVAPQNPEMTKEVILAEPAVALERLKKNVYFKDADGIFKLASSLYFSLYNKQPQTAQERKFVRTFRRYMYSFAPSFFDSLIFSHWKLTELRTAEMLSTSFLAQFEGHPLYPKVLFNLGRIQEDSKSYAQASKTFKKFLEKSDDATYLELTRFRLPWVLLLGKRENEAKPYFEEYVKHHPEGRYASTSEYFLIKINEKKDDREAHLESIDQFLKKYPLNFYAYLLIDEYKLSNERVRQTLSLENTLQTNARALLEFNGDIKTLSQLTLYHELKELGLDEDALKVLKNFSPDPNNGMFALYLASQFQSIQDTHGEVSNLIKAVANTRAFGTLIPWKRLFPDYRIDTIEKELTTQSAPMSPLLVLSLIRQESAFNPKAVSSANAQGLMQLIPKTAQSAANEMQIKDFSLLKEEDNLRLGIRTFNALLAKYNNRLDYALCAYNAGETPTNLWITLRGHLEPIQFIESIPYPETRIYVKSILRNFAIYRMLYESNPASLVSYNF